MPSVGQLEAAGPGPDRPREGAPLVAEQLGLEEPFRDGRGVDGDERPVLSEAEAVDGMREHLLARAALPWIRIVRSVGAARWAMSSTRLSGSHCPMISSKPVALPGAEHLDLLLESATVERARHHHLELGHLERLGEEVVRPARDRLHRDLPRAVSGHHDDRRLRRQLAALGQGVEAVHVRQLHVEQDQVVRGRPQAVEERARRRRDLHLVLIANEGLPEDEGEILVVLGDHDPLSHAGPHTLFPFGVPAAGASGVIGAGARAGSSTTNVVSDTPSLATSIRPRCASTIWRAMASPRPVPFAFVVKKGWKMRSRRSAGRPLPVLRTVTRTPPSSHAPTATSTRPSGGVA